MEHQDAIDLVIGIAAIAAIGALLIANAHRAARVASAPMTASQAAAGMVVPFPRNRAAYGRGRPVYVIPNQQVPVT